MKNKEFEELAKQAFQYAADQASEDGKGSLGVFADKYAELIIQECISNLYSNGYDDAMNQIKKHFGVENGS
jgi:hypothetical protein